MLDVEVLDHGKGVQREVTDLHDGRKLPIWPIWSSAYDRYLKIARDRIDVRDRSATLAVLSWNCTCTSSSAPSVGAQLLMNWASRGYSRLARQLSKKVIPIR